MSQTADNKVPISITILPAHLVALDSIAEQMDRSRSWVVARALDKFLAPQGGEPESGVLVRPDVAGLVSPRMASSGSHAPGEAPFSGDAPMENVKNTPQSAAAIVAGFQHHADAIRRASEHNNKVLADHSRARAETNRRNAEYLMTAYQTGKPAA